MNSLFRFPTAVKRDPDVDAWMTSHQGELGAIARQWFDVLRDLGDDVRELIALLHLLQSAYADMKGRLDAE